MQKHAILLAVLFLALFASPTSGQQHALTQGQCQADAAAWGPSGSSLWNTLDLSKPNPGSFGVASSDKATIEEINQRVQEMAQCVQMASPFDVYRRDYIDTQLFYAYVTWQRMHDFLLRHNLRDQFLQEDREGKR